MVEAKAWTAAVRGSMRPEAYATDSGGAYATVFFSGKGNISFDQADAGVSFAVVSNN